MSDLNTISIAGRLGSKPEFIQTKNGKAMTTFNIANTTGFGEYENTNWVSCKAYGKMAESIVKFFDKGSKIYVTGKLTVSQYKNKEGQQVSRTYVSVSEFYFGDSKKESSGTTPSYASFADEFSTSYF